MKLSHLARPPFNCIPPPSGSSSGSYIVILTFLFVGTDRIVRAVVNPVMPPPIIAMLRVGGDDEGDDEGDDGDGGGRDGLGKLVGKLDTEEKQHINKRTSRILHFLGMSAAAAAFVDVPLWTCLCGRGLGRFISKD